MFSCQLLKDDCLRKEDRSSEKGVEIEDGEKEKQNTNSQQTASLSSQPNRQLPVSTVLAQAEKQPVTDKRVVGLLKKAKAQLFKIEKSKLKPAEQTKVQVRFLFTFT